MKKLKRGMLVEFEAGKRGILIRPHETEYNTWRIWHNGEETWAHKEMIAPIDDPSVDDYAGVVGAIPRSVRSLMRGGELRNYYDYVHSSIHGARQHLYILLYLMDDVPEHVRKANKWKRRQKALERIVGLLDSIDRAMSQ
ncbi:MAG: hypothetical protein DRI48_00465 [Chloroflexi bacterium]|nr:MAG: hypothetical protein DRI48_00465 [Chloroflexota bacterium]